MILALAEKISKRINKKRGNFTFLVNRNNAINLWSFKDVGS